MSLSRYHCCLPTALHLDSKLYLAQPAPMVNIRNVSLQGISGAKKCRVHTGPIRAFFHTPSSLEQVGYSAAKQECINLNRTLLGMPLSMCQSQLNRSLLLSYPLIIFLSILHSFSKHHQQNHYRRSTEKMPYCGGRVNCTNLEDSLTITVLPDIVGVGVSETASPMLSSLIMNRYLYHFLLLVGPYS